MVIMRKYIRKDEYYQKRYDEYLAEVNKIKQKYAGTKKKIEVKSKETFINAYDQFAANNRTRKLEGKSWKSPFKQIIDEDTTTYSRKQAKAIKNYLSSLDDPEGKYQKIRLKDIRHGMLYMDDEAKFWEAVKARQNELKEKFSSQETDQNGESTNSRIVLEISKEFFGSL